jgi:Na+/H+-dicarboxylate symporter/ABC-type amino acid transport substrate-binding protein
MSEQIKRKFRLGLSEYILMGFVLGILCGFTFGEYCSVLKIYGDVYLKLLQMSILPYITVTLIAGIGRLTFSDAKVFAVKGGLLFLLFWGIAFFIILTMPLTFPELKTASFFSSSIVELKEKINFLELYIPSNPFRSLANAAVPAVVLFSISIGIALINLKNKDILIDNLSILSAALMKVALFFVKLAPIGVFALSASASGTITVEEFRPFQVYFITFIVSAILLTFWILPMLATTFLPFKYKDIIGTSKDACVTAFATGSLFVVLPLLSNSSKILFEKYKIKNEKASSFIDIILPIALNFPTVGRLLLLLFPLFAAWFSGKTLSIEDYPVFVFSGLFSFFADVKIAMPFMLDILDIPNDYLQLFIVTGIFIGRFALLLAAMSLFTFTISVTCSMIGLLKVNWKKVTIFATITFVLIASVIVGTRTFLNFHIKDIYTKDEVVAHMQSPMYHLPAVIHKKLPPVTSLAATGKSHLKSICERGFIRVGYNADRLPWSFFNLDGELVGFDIDMAHKLASDLSVTLKFFPFETETIVQQINDDQLDIVMSGIVITTTHLKDIDYSDSYLDVTPAFVVKADRKEEFATINDIKSTGDLRIGVPAYKKDYGNKIRQSFPLSNVIMIKAVRNFFEGNKYNLDALALSAEGSSAWTLLYPEYEVVVPKPEITKNPLGYPLVKGDQEMLNFINNWIYLKKKDGTIEHLYNYWILGKGAIVKEPRWSIIRNVLHWVD